MIKIIVTTTLGLLLLMNNDALFENNCSGFNSSSWYDYQCLAISSAQTADKEFLNDSLNFTVVKTVELDDTLQFAVAFMKKEFLTHLLLGLEEDSMLGFSSYDTFEVLIIGEPNSKKNYKKINEISQLTDYIKAKQVMSTPPKDSVVSYRIWEVVALHQTVFIHDIYRGKLVGKYAVGNTTIFR